MPLDTVDSSESGLPIATTSSPPTWSNGISQGHCFEVDPMSLDNRNIAVLVERQIPSTGKTNRQGA